MQQLIQQLKSAISVVNQHLTLIPEDLTSLGHPNLKRYDVPAALEGLAALYEGLDQVGLTPQQISLLKANIGPQINQLAASAGLIPQNPAAHTNQILASLNSAYNQAVNFMFLSEDKRPRDSLKDFLYNLIEKVGKQISVESIRDQVIAAKTEVDGETAKVKKLQQDIAANLDQTSAKLAAVLETENAVAKKTADFEKNYSSYVQIMTDVTAKQKIISDMEIQLSGLITESDKQQKIINQNLEDSNRAGMAGSFNFRKQELRWPIRIWASIFVSSLIGLCFLGIYFIIPTGAEAIEWGKFLLKIPASFPIIWIAWFAAQQYKFSVSLREEYAFKNASAMAYEGYKKEAKAVDPQLSQKLLDNSIANISENPMKAVNAQDHSETPLTSLVKTFASTLEKFGLEITKKAK